MRNPGRRPGDSRESSSSISSTSTGSSFGAQGAAAGGSGFSSNSAYDPAQNGSNLNGILVFASNGGQVQCTGLSGKIGNDSAISNVRQSSFRGGHASSQPDNIGGGDTSSSLPARQVADSPQDRKSVSSSEDARGSGRSLIRALKFNSQQLQQLDNLYQNFLGNIGGLNQDASDPAYRQRWITAQQLSDDEYQAAFGTDAFNIMQIHEMQRALGPPIPNQ